MQVGVTRRVPRLSELMSQMLYGLTRRDRTAGVIERISREAKRTESLASFSFTREPRTMLRLGGANPALLG